MSQEQDSFKKYKDFLTSTAGIWLLIEISVGFIILIVPILIVLVIGALIWFFYKHKERKR